MTKEQFLFQLEQQLLDIPEDERAEAVDYYRDYFNDAGEENEESVIAELGSPGKVAESIKEGLRSNREDAGTVGQPPQTRGRSQSYSEANRGRKQTDSRSKWILIILVAVFTSPLWIGAAGVVFGLLVGFLALVFGLTIAVAAMMLAGFVVGAVCVIAGILRFCTARFVSGLMTLGVGMLLLAMGFLCLAAIVLIFGQFLPWLLRAISNLLHNGFKRRRRVSVNE